MATPMRETINFGSEMADDFPCASCLRGNKHMDSVKYCVECKEYLCQTCLGYHEKFSSTMNHNVVSKLLVPTENITAIDISFQGDASPPRDVPGICAVTVKDSTGRYAILTDWYNEMVKVLDLHQLKVVDALKMKTKPYGICELPSSGLFAITLRDSEDLVILEFSAKNHYLDFFQGWDLIQDNASKQTCTGKVKAESRGVASIKGQFNDTIVIVSGGDPRKHHSKAAIGVYGSTETNELLYPIYKKEIVCSKSGCFPKNIVVSKDCKKVFLTDQAIGILVCDMKGQELGIVSNPILKEARGICMDNEGNMYVAGQVSENIVKLSADGQLLGEVVNKSHGLKSPISVCFIKDKRSILVGLRGSAVCMMIRL